MPIPVPTDKEKKDKKGEEQFIGRCMVALKNDYPDNKRRLAICYSALENSKKRKKAKGSDEDPDWDIDCDKGSHFIL